jgi:DNA-binding PadR family transcriptional regulator
LEPVIAACLPVSAAQALDTAASRPTISSIDISTMDSPRPPASFLPLPDAELEILIALADGEAHGYAIMRAVAERTEGRRRLGPGTLYTALKRLLAARLIEEGASRDGGGEEGRRRLYRLSRFGSRVLAAELDRLSALVRHGRKRLQVLPSGGRS